MDMSNHVAQRLDSERAMVLRDDRRLSLDLNRKHSVQGMLMKKIDKEVHALQKEIRDLRYPDLERKKKTDEKFPIYLPLWKELRLPPITSHRIVVGNRKSNRRKSTNELSFRDREKKKNSLVSNTQNLSVFPSRTRPIPIQNAKMDILSMLETQGNEQLLSINTRESRGGGGGGVGAVPTKPLGLSVRDKPRVIFTPEQPSIFSAQSNRLPANTINKEASSELPLIKEKLPEVIGRAFHVLLSTSPQRSIDSALQSSADTLLSPVQAVIWKGDGQSSALLITDSCRNSHENITNHLPDGLELRLSGQHLSGSDSISEDLKENQSIFQSDRNFVHLSTMNDRTSTRNSMSRRVSTTAAPGELKLLQLQREASMSATKNDRKLPESGSLNVRRASVGYNILPKRDDFNQRRQSDGSVVFRLPAESSSPSPSSSLGNRLDTFGLDVIHNTKLKVEDRPRRNSLNKPCLLLDREMFNSDGTLRAMYCLPTFEESWDQASRARYIRTRETKFKEMSIEEVFSKKSNENIDEEDEANSETTSW